LGEKWKEVKMMLTFLLPWATKQGCFSIDPQTRMFFIFIPRVTKLERFDWPPNLEHFKGHQVWNLSLPTKLRVFLYLLLPSVKDTKNHKNKSEMKGLSLTFKQGTR